MSRLIIVSLGHTLGDDPRYLPETQVSDTAITLIILAVSVVLFVMDRLPVAVVALLVPLALWATGVLDLGAAMAGFGDPTILFIGALFVVSEALDRTGITTWVGNQVMERGGKSALSVSVTLLLAVAILTALITPNGSVAALMPVIVVIAIRGRRSPSELLMPAAFSAHAGSLLMLTGSPVTVIVADYIEEVGGGRMGLFSIGAIGIPLVLATIVVCVTIGGRLVPRREPLRALRDFGDHAAVLSEHYDLQDTDELMDRSIVAGGVPRAAAVGLHRRLGLPGDEHRQRQPSGGGRPSQRGRCARGDQVGGWRRFGPSWPLAGPRRGC